MLFRQLARPRSLRSARSLSDAAHKKCWSCGATNDASSLFCKADDCGRIQDVDAKSVNYFRMFDLPKSSFNIDLKELETQFKNMQKLLHPDKFATKSISEKNFSSSASSMVNQAYQVLRSPMDRVNYILMSRFNINILDETSMTIKDPVLMNEMFILRETASEITTKEEMSSFIADRHRELKRLGAILDGLMDKYDEAERQQPAADPVLAARFKLKEEIQETAVRMKYLSKVVMEMEKRLDELS